MVIGLPTSVYAKVGIYLPEIDVEDTADIILECIDSDEFPVTSIRLLQKPARNYTHVQENTILFNYCENLLVITINNSQPEFIKYNDFKRNDMFLSEVSDFISSIAKKDKPPIPLEHGIDVLRVCMAAKKSLQSGQIEVIK